MTNKKIKNLKKNNNLQKGGNVITASVDVVNSITSLGKSIFGEIKAITNIQSDINNAASPKQGTPNVISGPPTFKAPKL